MLKITSKIPTISIPNMNDMNDTNEIITKNWVSRIFLKIKNLMKKYDET